MFIPLLILSPLAMMWLLALCGMGVVFEIGRTDSDAVADAGAG